jgi:hypothetical protein
MTAFAAVLPFVPPVAFIGGAIEVWLVLRLRAAWHRKSASEQALLTSIVAFSKPGRLRIRAIERTVPE